MDKPKSQFKVYTFLYPSYGDIHKNFELLCRATALLEKEIGHGRFKVILTISGTNKYTQWLYKEWGKNESLEFAGFMDKKRIYDTYAQADCLVFPSKVETWGLPISDHLKWRLGDCPSVSLPSSENRCYWQICHTLMRQPPEANGQHSLHQMTRKD